MKSKDLTELLKGELTDQIAAYIESENPFPEGIIDWLAELVLLENIPFNNIIADENLLPNESMRLFYLDKNWTNAALDGALSIGIHSERDMLLQAAMNNILRQKTNNKLGAKKSILGTISGLMIRSSIVSNYPNFQILAYEDIEKLKPIQLIRNTKLATNISFVLFETIPRLIEIKTATEHQTLAIINNEVQLRSIDKEIGKRLDKNLKLTDSDFRNKEKRVLNITNLQQNIALQLGKTNLSPAEFAIQLEQSPTVFELVNEDIEILQSKNTTVETQLNKELIFSKLFQ